MRVYFDTNIVIYFIEQPAGWGQRASTRVSKLQANRDQFVVSDLTRMECRVGPIKAKDPITLAQFDAFFQALEVEVLLLTTAIIDRATLIRAQRGYSLPDALHLAAAAEAGCDVFLTNDTRLSNFPGITVEILP